MRKTFVSRPASRKQRGVAIVFSLGILGLLTVLALGFASTALLNNSISKNVMNDAYARTLARNLALTQAIYVIDQKAIEADRRFVDYRKIYTYGTEDYSTLKDFLWKLDCSFSGKSSDGKDLSTSIYTYTPDDTASNPANHVRWQYVKDSNPDPDKKKILGRYAYVVIPEKGGICPSINTGAAVPTTANFTEDVIKSLEKYVSMCTTTKGDMANTSTRWMSYGELIAKCQWSATSATQKRYYTNMFKHYGITPALAVKTPEAYWDTDGDGKLKLYSRFNLNQGADYWAPGGEDDITPEKLCGVGTTLKEFKNGDGEFQRQECIPWLKKMYDNEPTRNQALQIAANIIQYNRASTADSVSNLSDWLADDGSDDGDENSHVKYIGIGRHPMLNELGFMVHVKAAVEAVLVSEDPENSKATYTYTPKYYVTLTNGAELLYQCGLVSALTKVSEVTFGGNFKVGLRKIKDPEDLKTLLSAGTLISSDGAMTSDGLLDTSSLATLTVPMDATAAPTATEEGDPVTLFAGTGYGWTGFKLSFAKTTTGWNSDPVYTKASLFWKQKQGGSSAKKQCFVVELPAFQLETDTGIGAHGDISIPLAKGMCVEKIVISPKKILLKYDNKNRDFVRSLEEYTMDTPSDFKPGSASDPAEEHVWFVAYEATDPLVNLNKTDWTKRTMSTAPAVWDEATSLTSNTQYPGSLYDDAGDEKHTNKTLSESSFATSHAGELLKLYGNASDTETPEPAFTLARRLPTGIIRHGQMLSFWELGCISRGKPFETLNLLKKSGASPDFSYEKGDAVLFDQLKLSDNDYTEGKVNVNADRHKVLEQIFGYSTTLGFLMQSGTSSKISALAYRKNVHVTASGKTPGAHLLAVGSADRTYVKCISQTAPSTSTMYPSPIPTTDHTTTECLPCTLRKVTEKYCIQNRGDLLLDQADLPATGGTVPSEDDWTAFQDLLQFGDTYLEKIQIAAKIMPILRAEPMDVLYVVVLAQSIKDMGGNVPVFRDWNSTGVDSNISSNSGAGSYKTAMYASGFRRTPAGAAIAGLTEPAVKSTDDGTSGIITKLYTHNSFGKYDLGSDKITGEARLVATLVRDPETNKWKLLRVQNVE
ncbi:MAG: hypothetical protein IJS14_07240 [Lentisphaeria bacterium]|nr:hypothetical protein [Lentisphaeria bacterium]